MTVEAGTVDTRQSPGLLARWPRRAAALSIDVLPAGAVIVAVGLVTLALPIGGLWWWVCIVIAAAAVLFSVANRVLRPTVTGRSLGRAALGIAVTGAAGEPVGAGRLLLREAAHLLDTAAVGAGWIWPLWEARRRTFADLLTRTEVRETSTDRLPPNRFGPAAVVATAAVLTCVAAAALGYFAVYRPDRAAGAARAQLEAVGPKIVVQLLSYEPESLADDFARAQSVATAHYREQLVPQQQVIQQGKPAPNMYQAINAAVLDATPRRGTMLVFLQGQRGSEGSEHLITATVRVAFAKVAEDWLVDDLVAVTRPQSGEEGE